MCKRVQAKYMLCCACFLGIRAPPKTESFSEPVPNSCYEETPGTLWFGEIPYCLPAPQFLLHFRFHSTAYSKILSCQALEMWSVEHFTLSHAHSPETIVIRQLAWDQTWSNYIKLAYASNSRQWAESCAQNIYDVYDIQVRYSFNCQVEPQIKPCLFARQPVKPQAGRSFPLWCNLCLVWGFSTCQAKDLPSPRHSKGCAIPQPVAMQLHSRNGSRPVSSALFHAMAKDYMTLRRGTCWHVWRGFFNTRNFPCKSWSPLKANIQHRQRMKLETVRRARLLPYLHTCAKSKDSIISASPATSEAPTSSPKYHPMNSLPSRLSQK